MNGSRFQIHLGTAILLSIVAGLLLYLNIAARELSVTQIGDGLKRIRVQGYGWPLPAYSWYFVFDVNENVTAEQIDELRNKHLYDAPEFVNRYGRTLGSLPVYAALIIFVDVPFALILLLITGYASEWFIRRRKFGRV